MGYGHMEGPNTPESYAEKTLACCEAMQAVDPELQFAVSGPYPNETWIQDSLAPLSEKVDCVSFHSYQPFTASGAGGFTTPAKAAATYHDIISAPGRNLAVLKQFRAAWTRFCQLHTPSAFPLMSGVSGTPGTAARVRLKGSIRR